MELITRDRPLYDRFLHQVNSSGPGLGLKPETVSKINVALNKILLIKRTDATGLEIITSYKFQAGKYARAKPQAPIRYNSGAFK